MSQEKDIYNHIFNKIAQKLQIANSNDWKNKEFVLVSKSILEDTKISISPDTLKRLIGHRGAFNYKFSAQKDTKKAILNYAGYMSWEQAAAEIEGGLKTPNVSRNSSPTYKIWAYSFLALLISFSIVFYILEMCAKSKGKIVVDYKLGVVPNTVKIHYIIQQRKWGDSIFLDMGYGLNYHVPTPEKNILIQKDTGTIVHCYAIPDVFHIKLRNQKQEVLDSMNVVLETKDWEGYLIIKHKLDNQIQIEINNSKIGINEKGVEKYRIESENDAITELRNFQNYSIDGDNFDFSTKMRVKKGISCYDASFTLVGEKQLMFFSFVNPGCEKWASFKTSELYYTAEKFDLGFLGVDFTAFHKVKILNKDKNLRLFVDNRELYKANYSQSLGNLKGIYFSFKGLGEIDSTFINNTPLW